MKFVLSSVLMLSIVGGSVQAAPAALRTSVLSPRSHVNPAAQAVVKTIYLHDKRVVKVYSSGFEVLTSAKGKVLRETMVPNDAVESDGHTLSQGTLLKPLLFPKPKLPYPSDQLVVVFSSGGAPAGDHVRISPSELRSLRLSGAKQSAMAARIPAYSTSYAANRVLAQIGTSSLDRIASNINRSLLSQMHARAASNLRVPLLDVSNAYVVHFTNAPLRTALEALRKTQGVEYASPNWYVSTMEAASTVVAPAHLTASRTRSMQSAFHRAMSSAQGSVSHSFPGNYAISSSAQSLLNSSSINAVAAYDIIERNFGQLPGEGQSIANISIGDISDGVNQSDPCYDEFGFGATTHLIGGQHYIDWPSMPLIPAYVVDANGNASGSASVCGSDPQLGEIGLDFSMMAPLPHQLQRPGELGAGYSDLLGIAPGAKYSLYVPGNPLATFADIDTTFLAAANAPPSIRPTVITASLGFGFDAYGFPGRFLEEDPITASVIASIVNGSNIVVCVSANDGTRTYTNVAIGPSGGSAPTNIVPLGSAQTNLNDLAYTTIPSEVADYGAIDVGGSTLDDTLALGSSDPALAALREQPALPETRFTGMRVFSSGFGSRVNVSAPSDNVLALSHLFDGAYHYDYDQVSVDLSGGTSASSPEVAAVAAVAMQVAKLTGHPFQSPAAVRQFLIQTGHQLPSPPQADQQVNVGPQVDVGAAVSSLLNQSGKPVPMSVPRVAVRQHRSIEGNEAVFFSDAQAWNIDIQQSGSGDGSDDGQLWPITIAPDWEGVPANAQYRLTLANKPDRVLATTPIARFLPGEILQAAGLPVAANTERTVQLQYTAKSGLRSVSTSFSLTFTAADATTAEGLPPTVAPVTSGSTMNVSYDISNIRTVSNPTLWITEPGRFQPTVSLFDFPLVFHPSYTVPLTQKKGTIQVPVSALQGAGTYGVAIQIGETASLYGLGMKPLFNGHWAFTRVVQGASTRANPVTISADGTNFSHTAYIPFGATYQAKWDVSNVAGATGALLEIGPSGPTVWGLNYNAVNNPNGSIPDHNGTDSPSVYTQTVSGATGTVSLSGLATLTPTLYNQIRVIPMNGSTPVGEASDVSTISMSGYVPPDGVPISSFTVGNSGNAEVMTFENSGNYVVANNIFPFDSSTGVMGAPFYTTNYENVAFPQGVVSASNYQFLEDINLAAFLDGGTELTAPGFPEAASVGLPDSQANGLSWGPLFGSTNPFPKGPRIIDFASSRQSDSELVASETTSPGVSISLMTLQLPGTNLGSPVDATAAYTSFQSMFPSGGLDSFATHYDPSMNSAVIDAGINPSASGASCASTNAHAAFIVSMATGQIQSFPVPGVGVYFSYYDPISHVLATADLCGKLEIYNVATHQSTVVQLQDTLSAPGPIAIDSKNHLILIGSIIGPDFYTNNDAQSSIAVYDENGNLQKTLVGMLFPGPPYAPDIELDENTRTLLVQDTTDFQLEPVSY